MVIYKYKMELKNLSEVMLPAYHKILDIQYIDNGLFLWAIVDINRMEEPVIRKFKIVGTGHDELTDQDIGRYVKTIYPKNGFVWHIFEQE